jgi:hypothetical protein
MADLKAGRMGPSSVTGKPADFASSMAEAIEDAYWASLVADGKDTFDRSTNSESDRDRRRIFIAIAQGVIGYLADNEDAFRVAVPTVPSTTSVDIRTAP